MMPGPGIKPRTHWWEASALITAPTLLHRVTSDGYLWLRYLLVLFITERAPSTSDEKPASEPMETEQPEPEPEPEVDTSIGKVRVMSTL